MPHSSMPHWINLSFYSRHNRVSVCHRSFTARVRLPPKIEQLIPDKSALTDVYFPRIEQLPQFGNV